MNPRILARRAKASVAAVVMMGAVVLSGASASATLMPTQTTASAVAVHQSHAKAVVASATKPTVTKAVAAVKAAAAHPTSVGVRVPHACFAGWFTPAATPHHQAYCLDCMLRSPGGVWHKVSAIPGLKSAQLQEVQYLLWRYGFPTNRTQAVAMDVAINRIVGGFGKKQSYVLKWLNEHGYGESVKRSTQLIAEASVLHGPYKATVTLTSKAAWGAQGTATIKVVNARTMIPGVPVKVTVTGAKVVGSLPTNTGRRGHVLVVFVPTTKNGTVTIKVVATVASATSYIAGDGILTQRVIRSGSAFAQDKASYVSPCPLPWSFTCDCAKATFVVHNNTNRTYILTLTWSGGGHLQVTIRPGGSVSINPPRNKLVTATAATSPLKAGEFPVRLGKVEVF